MRTQDERFFSPDSVWRTENLFVEKCANLSLKFGVIIIGEIEQQNFCWTMCAIRFLLGAQRLVKSAPIVNFINNKRTNFFCMNVCFCSFYYVHVTIKSCPNDVHTKNARILCWWNWRLESVWRSISKFINCDHGTINNHKAGGSFWPSPKIILTLWVKSVVCL